MTTTHRISDDGQTIVCESTPDAHCRTSPDCDTETWDADGCHKHREYRNSTGLETKSPHPVTPGHECWWCDWLNDHGLQETWNEWDSGRVDIRPGAAVKIKFHSSDEGCSWTYAEATP